MSSNSLNLERTQSLFVLVGVLLVAMSLLLANVPELQLSTYVELSHRRQISGVLYGLGGLLGYLTWRRYTAMQAKPWQVPQSQVSILFSIFSVVLAAAILLSK